MGRFAFLFLVAAVLRLPLPAAADAPGADLFGGGVIPRLRIEIPPEGMNILRSYEWNKSLNGQDRTNVLATVREGNKVYTNVAVHLKGGLGSYRAIDDQPALTLTFDKLVKEQRFHGLQKIYLNNSVQDPSYLSEQICREMFLAAGLPSPRAGHAVVRLNERNLGLYVLLEGWNKQFLKQHFQDARGDLYDGGYGNDITNRLEINCGSFPNDWSRLQQLSLAVQEPDVNRRLDRMNEALDVDRFLTFMAMEIMLAHWDGYSMNRNNFRLFDDRSVDRLVFLPHGMDQMFGVFRSTPSSTITPHMKSIVSHAVIETPEGRRRYLERMSQLLTNVFQIQPLTNRVQQLARQLRPVLARDQAALTRFNFAVDHLIMRMTQRAESVAQQLREPPKPLHFDAAGQALLSDWRPQRDSGSPSFASSAGRNGMRFLEIRSSGGLAYGSWRTTVLLEEGDYQLIGRVQTEGLQVGAGVTRGGVTLRKSGERAAKMIADATQWTELTYDFSMPALAEIELLCEFRGSSGRARFDAASLHLVRKSAPK